ncbi:hypothetical protein [Streptococcus mitis]|uniref:hypothetical protein n=1 Tax=Streptococcus mitis TaxID=28037 RepID=UPI001F34209D|nr:hypothetical protein [Streptococcus mitis]
MELQGGALFWFSPKFTRQKFSNRENFFQLAPFLPTKIFPFSTKKFGKKVCALHARKRAQSILTDEPADKIFREPREKNLAYK